MSKHQLNEPVEVFINKTIELRVRGYRVEMYDGEAEIETRREIEKRINLFPEFLEKLKECALMFDDTELAIEINALIAKATGGEK